VADSHRTRRRVGECAGSKGITEHRGNVRLASGNEEPLLLGIDLGSTSTKAVIYDPEGRAVASESVPTVTHYPRPLWAYYEPEELWQGVVAAIRSAIEKIDSPSRVASVAVASFAEAGVPIDEEDTPTYPMIAWFDRRTLPQMEWLAETIGEERLFQTTGLSLLPIFSLNKLLWIRENEQSAWRRTVRWLMAADYIAYRLCGERATDYSLASRSLVFNLAELNWDKTVLERVGMPPDLFAPAVLAGTRLGNVTRRAAEETGLTVDTVVGAGGHDHVCGSFAAGVTGRGQLLDSMGTAEALFVAQERPITDPALGQLGYTQGAHVVPDTYYTYGTVITSGASVEWLRSILGAIDHVALIDEASAIPAGSYGATFVPHLRLADAPHPDSKARGAFIGLTTDASRPAIRRARYEGLA
jgi:xylulokinase